MIPNVTETAPRGDRARRGRWRKMSANVTATAPRTGRPQGPSVEQLALAVALLADDRQTDEAIAAALNVSRRTLARWKHHPLYRPMCLAVVAHYRLQLDREWEAKWRAREVEQRQAAAERPARRRRR